MCWQFSLVKALRCADSFCAYDVLAVPNYGLHDSSARAEKLPRSRTLLGLDPTLPEVEALSLQDWLAEILGDEYNQCPHCGASGSLFERATFEQLPWLVGLMLALFGQPTRVGVCR